MKKILFWRNPGNFITWRYPNMKTTIGIKIGFAFFVLLLLFGVVGTKIFYSVNEGMSTLEQIKEDSRKQIKAGNLRFRVTQVLMATNDYVITNKEYYKQEYQRLNALLDKDYQDFIQSGLTDKEKQLTYEIRIDIDSIQIYSEKIFSITNPRQSSYVWELMEIMDYNFGNAINAKTTLIFDGVSERIEENSAKAEMAKQKIIALVQRVILIILIFSLMITYFSIVNIARPIKKIAKAADFVAKGDYTKRIEIKTHDEIESLANSFNQMSESIQQSHKALEESKRLTETIVATVPVGLLVYDSKGKIMSANNSFCNNFNLVQNLLLHQNIEPMLNELKITEECRSHILAREPMTDVECSYSNPIKGLRFMNLSLREIKLTDGESLLIIEDITEKKKTEEWLMLFNTAIEVSAVSVAITDAKGNINYVNPFFTESTGYSSEEVLGKTHRILASGNTSKAFYKDLWTTLLSGNIFKGEIQNRRKNGELFWDNAVISPILNNKGVLTNYISIREDITERKKMLDELIVAKEKAEESNRLKSAFLANMSHEIRTPLNSILGFTELLLEPDLSSEKKESFIKIVLQSGQRMLNTVSDIVEISKIEAGLIQLNLTKTDVNGRMEELFRFFQPEANKKGIKLSLEMLLPPADKNITTDQNKLDSILTNLIKNAIKYTDSGTIKMGCRQKDRFIEFFIKDTGIGIPKDRQEAIFERFIQADITDTRALQGSGLGLAIAKSYVEMLGGNIWAESTEGEGSTFYFTLPTKNNNEEKS